MLCESSARCTHSKSQANKVCHYLCYGLDSGTDFHARSQKLFTAGIIQPAGVFIRQHFVRSLNVLKPGRSLGSEMFWMFVRVQSRRQVPVRALDVARAGFRGHIQETVEGASFLLLIFVLVFFSRVGWICDGLPLFWYAEGARESGLPGVH